MAKEIVLALGGGGVRGVAHLGVVQCLLDNHYKINAMREQAPEAVWRIINRSRPRLDVADNSNTLAQPPCSILI